MLDRELYDKICHVLTLWEHPEESDEIVDATDLYDTLVDVQNAFAEEKGY